MLTTVKPVLSGPVLNGHPLLSGQLQKSRKFLLLNTLNVASIKRSPLLSGRGHLLQSPSEGISIVLTCIKRSLHKRKPYEHTLNVVILNQKQLFLLTNDREMLNSYYLWAAVTAKNTNFANSVE